MKTYLYSSLPDTTLSGLRYISADGLPGEEVNGKNLDSDVLGFTCYEVSSPGGRRYQTAPPADVNHVYYCVDGEIEATLAGDDEKYLMRRNSVLALPPAVTADFIFLGSSRMLVFYVSSVSDTPSKPEPLFRTISDIIGTDRDVDWQRGRSRRFLIKADGFNISVHDTIAFPNHSSHLCYENNHEFCYYVRGEVTYRWADGKKESDSFKQDDQSHDDGFTVIIPKGEAHYFDIGTREIEGICAFFPPLKGTEAHDFTKDGHSSY